MDKDLTHLLLVLDRSGSMSKCKEAMEESLEGFLNSQRKVPGKVDLTLITFDDESEMVVRAKPLDSLKRIEIHPRGSTALYDAMCFGIDEVGAMFAARPESSRPSKVLMIIITDGYENASHQFNAGSVQERITHQKKQYNWEFLFLGANQDAILSARKFGLGKEQTISFNSSHTGTGNTISVMDSYTTSVRSGNAVYSISEEDRVRSMEDDNSQNNPIVSSSTSSSTNPTTPTTLTHSQASTSSTSSGRKSKKGGR